MKEQKLLDFKVKAVLSFYDGENPEPYDGTEIETTYRELMDMYYNPHDYCYDTFYIDDIDATEDGVAVPVAAEDGKFYCSVFRYSDADYDADYEELYPEEYEMLSE